MTTRLMDHILPPPTSAYDRTLASQVDRLLELGIPIRHLWDPWQCPAEMLSYLAWTMSIEIWDNSWSEIEKRSVIAKSLDLHRLKGTEEGIRRYLDLLDVPVKRVIAPPQIAFASKSVTPEEYRSFLALMPQLRVYPYRGHDNRPWTFFARSSALGITTGPRRRFLVPSTAPSRAGRRAVLEIDGVETDLSVTVTPTIFNQEVLVEREMIHVKTFKPATFALGTIKRKKRFATSLKSLSITVPIASTTPFGAITLDRVRQVVSPGLIPIDATPLEMNERSTPPKDKFFVGRGAKRFVRARSYLYPSKAYLHIYDVLWLYRPGIDLPPRHGRMFANVTRLGMAPHTAEMKIQLRRKSPKRKMFARGYAGFAHSYPTDPSLINEAIYAVRTAKSLRDEIYLNLNCTDTVRAGPLVLSGDVVCGEQVETF